MSRNIGPPMTDERMIVRPTPSRPEILLAVKRREWPDVRQSEGETDRLRAQIELTASEDEQDGEPHRPEEVEESSARGDVLQVRMAQDVAEALAQLGAHLPARRPVRLRGLRLANREDEQCRAEEADRVDENGRAL